MHKKLSHNLTQQFLSKLGLTDEEVQIYSALTQYGDLSILQLSRRSGVQRTKIYRLVEEMTKKNIIEEIVGPTGRRLKASDPDILEQLVYEQEENVELLKKLLPEVQKDISNITTQAQPGTKVVFYRGQSGIKQMIWNTLSAKSEILGYTYRRLSEITGEKFSQKWHQEYKTRGLVFRELYSDSYLDSTESGRKPTNDYESRFIPTDVLNINHQTDIYDDVVSHYNWHEGEVFGIEIHNKKVAKMQRQIFEIIWKIAEFD